MDWCYSDKLLTEAGTLSVSAVSLPLLRSVSGLRTYEAICYIYQVNVSLRLSVSEQLNLNNSLLYRVSGVSVSIDDRMEELCL